jgi:hypothetical protein
VDKIRSLLNKDAANKEDASTAFFNQTGTDLMTNSRWTRTISMTN